MTCFYVSIGQLLSCKATTICPFNLIHFKISGVLVMGIGSITFSLPHFLTGAHVKGSFGENNNSSMSNICLRNNQLMSSTKTKASAGEELLMSLPGLEKIKTLTEGEHLIVLDDWAWA